MSKLQQRAFARHICNMLKLKQERLSSDDDFFAEQVGLYEPMSDLEYDGSLTNFMTPKETDRYLWAIDAGLEEAEEQIKKWRYELDKFHNSFYDNPAEFTKLIAKLGVEK